MHISDIFAEAPRGINKVFRQVSIICADCLLDQNYTIKIVKILHSPLSCVNW